MHFHMASDRRLCIDTIHIQRHPSFDRSDSSCCSRPKQGTSALQKTNKLKKMALKLMPSWSCQSITQTHHVLQKFPLLRQYLLSFYRMRTGNCVTSLTTD